MRFGWCTGIQNILLAQQIGFSYLECPVSDLAAMPEPEFAKSLELLSQADIGVECLNILFPGGMSLLTEEEESLRRYLEKAFRRGKAAGAKLVVLGSGRVRSCPPGMDYLEGCRRLTKATRLMGEMAAAYGLILAIEPLNRKETNLIHSVKQAALLAAQVNLGNVQLLADAYHLFEEQDHLEDLPLVGHLAHTHVATPEDRTFPVRPDPFLERFFAVLKQMGYDKRMSIEGASQSPEKDGPKALAVLEELAARC